jgi:hypothetical protein
MQREPRRWAGASPSPIAAPCRRPIAAVNAGSPDGNGWARPRMGLSPRLRAETSSGLFSRALGGDGLAGVGEVKGLLGAEEPPETVGARSGDDHCDRYAGHPRRWVVAVGVAPSHVEGGQGGKGPNHDDHSATEGKRH